MIAEPATETLLDLWGRCWDSAWELDDRRGDNAATTFVALELRRLGSDLSTARDVAALADKLERRARDEPSAHTVGSECIPVGDRCASSPGG